MEVDMQIRKTSPWILVLMLHIPINATAQQNQILLKCERISEDKDEATVEIDLIKKKITFDSLDERAYWDEFIKFTKKSGMEFGPYTPSTYNITEVTNLEIVGPEHKLGVHGKIQIKRNSLTINASIYRKNVSGGPVASSYKCQKIQRAF